MGNGFPRVLPLVGTAGSQQFDATVGNFNLVLPPPGTRALTYKKTYITKLVYPLLHVENDKTQCKN